MGNLLVLFLLLFESRHPLCYQGSLESTFLRFFIQSLKLEMNYNLSIVYSPNIGQAHLSAHISHVDENDKNINLGRKVIFNRNF